MSDAPETLPRQQQLIVTIFGLYCRGEHDAIAVADLITLLGDCGVESSAVRSSVSRLKKRGLLVNRRVGRATVYAPSPQMREVFDEGDQRIFDPRRAEPDDPWLLAAFSVPETKRHLRHRIRSIFTKWGAGSVTPGVWIAPSLNADRIRAELAFEHLDAFVEFFSALHLGDASLKQKVAQWWNLGSLAELYDQFVDQWQPQLDLDDQLSPADAFCRYVLLMTQWRRLPYLDPGLPLAYLPDPWPAERAAQLMVALRERYAPLAQQHVDAVTASSSVG